jgi:ubiquinone/menaquinone biosynthesis C-methylase UbiE
MPADYGLDAPKLVRRFAVRGALLAAFAAVLYFVNRESSPGIGPLAGAVFLIGLAFLIVSGDMVLSSRVAKIKMRDRILATIPWRGDEQVLDVGCGRGLFLIGAAKLLKTGKATGVDIWRPEDLSGNSADTTLANAKAEGVAGRVKIETADARQLPFAASSFDVALSSLAIHNIAERSERAKALAEIARVLKPGGYLAIFDIFHTREYAQELGRLGFTEVHLSPMTFPWCVPARTLTARKAS